MEGFASSLRLLTILWNFSMWAVFQATRFYVLPRKTCFEVLEGCSYDTL